MELRGRDDDSDGDDFLPQHRRLGLGRLYQEGELGSIAPSTASTTLSSLNYNHSGILASGSAFRRPPIFPSPLSSSTLPPSAATTPPSLRQSPQAPQHQKQHAGVLGRGSPADAGDSSQHKPPPVQLPCSLDPKLSLVGDRSPREQQQQQQQQGDTRQAQPDAASPTPFPTAASGPPVEATARSSPNSRTEAAAALPATKTRFSSAGPSNSAGTSVRYRECLKNHAARVGGHVLDGCGEFMPGGEEGTPEALKCAACTCHRSFHRKEVEDREEAEGLFLPVPFASSPQGAQQSNPRRYYLPGVSGNGAYPAGGAARCSSGARNVHNPSPLSLQTPSTHGLHQQHSPIGMLPPSSGGGTSFAPAPVPVRFGGGGGTGHVDDEENANYSGGTTTTESSSEEMHAHTTPNSVGGSSFHHGTLPATHALQTPPVPGGGRGVVVTQQQQQQYLQGVGASASSKKRFRTKFTAEQKDMMAEFAERVGWRMQKQDETALEQFCRAAGVTRQVFKVWMHNNKHALLKTSKQQQPPPPPHGEEQQQRQQQQSSSSS